MARRPDSNAWGRNAAGYRKRSRVLDRGVVTMKWADKIIKKYDPFWFYKEKNLQPFDWNKLSFGTKAMMSILEYIMRVIAACSFSVALIAISIIPLQSTTRKFFNIMRVLVDLFKGKYKE
jgi:hypothetical protein